MIVKCSIGVASAIYLSEDPDYPLSCVQDFLITSSIVVQEEAVIRAAAPFKAGRGNQTVECSFSVVRSFPDIATSFARAVDEPATFDELCDIEFLYPPEPGTSIAQWANCEVKCTTKMMGVSVISSYSIRGVLD